jgi:hypothetical protein
MDEDVTIAGTEALGALSRQLKEIGDKDLRRELLSGIQRAARPIKDAAKASAMSTLPASGGLNRRIAGGKFSVQTRTGRDPAVRIKAPGDARLDKGRLRHPVFGNRRVWVLQQIRPGWFSKPVEAGKDQVVADIEDVMGRVADRIIHG